MSAASVSGSDSPPGTSSKHEIVYDAIRGRILDGSYGPGHRLVLDRLAREFDVSPVPVREAVRRLEAQGYVEFQRNIGARVATFDEARFAETTEVLAVLEGVATALAAPRMRKSDIAAARRSNERLNRLLGDFDPVRFSRENRVFHFVFYDRCPNTQLRALVDEQWAKLDTIRRSSFIFVPGRARSSVEEHEHIIRLVERGAAGSEIESVTRAHKLHTIQALAAASAARGGRPPSRNSS
jgi:DNA-binding GntR family transcriptional regulator